MTLHQQSPVDRTLCAVGAFFFRFRNGLFPAVFVLVALFVRPAFFAGSRVLDPCTTAAGAALALLGETVRCLTIGLVYIERGGRNYNVYASSLVTQGIYAHTRNPMYVGNLLLTLGFCLMYGSPWMIVVVFPFFLLVYMGIVFEEERFLSGKFGATYDAYCRDTNRFLPRIAGWVQTLKQHRFDWRYVIKKEYGTLFMFSFGTYAVLAFKYRYLLGPEGILGRPGLLVLGAIPLGVLYGAARFLKKTGRL